MKYCPYCGAGLDEDMLFCPKCGKRFESEKENPHYAGMQKSEIQSIPVKAAPVGTETSAPATKKKHSGMIAIIAVVVIMAVIGGLFASGAFAPKEPESTPEPTPEPVIPFSDDTAAIAAASDSVVMLTCYDKNGEPYCTGSGFAIFEDGVIVTNFHVIDEEVYCVKAETESGRSFDCPTVLAYDAEKDIAILKANRKTELALLTPGDSENLQKGEKVVAIGSPLGLINSVSTGVFSGYIDDKIGQVLQFTAAISHGSSGGALFNDAGEVIGITFASLTEGQNLNLAVPIVEVQQLYENAISAKAVSMEAFYDSFEHVPPIPTYTVGYVLENYDELDGQEFFMEGYLSSISISTYSDIGRAAQIFLVEKKDDVLGGVGKGNGELSNHDFDMLMKDYYNVEHYRCVGIRVAGEEFDWLKPSEKIRVQCQLVILPDHVDGKRVYGGYRLSFTPYDIAVIEE